MSFTEKWTFHLRLHCRNRREFEGCEPGTTAIGDVSWLVNTTSYLVCGNLFPPPSAIAIPRAWSRKVGLSKAMPVFARRDWRERNSRTSVREIARTQVRKTRMRPRLVTASQYDFGSVKWNTALLPGKRVDDVPTIGDQRFVGARSMPGVVGARVSVLLFVRQEDSRGVKARGVWGGGGICRISRHARLNILHAPRHVG
jgi:hypothetical protein